MTTTTTFKPLARIASSEQIKEDFNHSRIYRSIRRADAQRLLSAINRGANLHLYDNDELMTYLHLVVVMANQSTEQSFLPMVYILSNYGIEVNAQDARGRTALELAINKQLCHVSTALIRVGTDLTERDYKAMIQRVHGAQQQQLLDAYDKLEPGLWGAVKRGSQGQAQLLVNSWCRVNVVKHNKTLIEYAVLTRKPDELVRLLREAEVALEFVHATLAGDERMMLQLLERHADDCDTSAMDISHHEHGSDTLQPRSLRDTAAAMGHTHLLHLLPDDAAATDDEYVQPAACDVVQHYNDVDDYCSQSLSQYSDSIAAASDSMTSSLQRDIHVLDINQNNCDIITANDGDSRSDVKDTPRTQTAPVPVRRERTSLLQKPVPTPRKRYSAPVAGEGVASAVDEGYNSTVSSGSTASSMRSFSSRQRRRLQQDAMTSNMSQGRYKRNSDSFYYYTSAAVHNDQAAAAAAAAAGAVNNDVTQSTANTIHALTNDAKPPSSKTSKSSSLRSKTRKQRARIYWQQDPTLTTLTDDVIASPQPPLPKPRKSKRSLSIRVSRKYDHQNDLDDQEARSRMCSIQ